jgi:hypothetical protein
MSAPAITNATVEVNASGHAVISTVHPTTGEGWKVIVPRKYPVEVREHHYSDDEGRVVITTTSYPTLAEALRYISSVDGAA